MGMDAEGAAGMESSVIVEGWDGRVRDYGGSRVSDLLHLHLLRHRHLLLPLGEVVVGGRIPLRVVHAEAVYPMYLGTNMYISNGIYRQI